MKITLISAIRRKEISHRAIPQLGLYYLKAYAEKLEPSIKIEVVNDPEEVLQEKPDIVGISAVTENMPIALAWAEMFREKLDVPLLLGGNHISAIPETLPNVFDVGIIGEGEQTFTNLIRLMKDDPNWRKKLDSISGICFHSSGKVRITDAMPLLESLSVIPIPERDPMLWGNFHYLFSSRGCPFNCIFCSPKTIWKKYRTFPASYVLDELDSIYNLFNPTYIHFFDDLFIGDSQRVEEISRLTVQRRYHRRTSFSGHIRANLVNEDLLKHLRSMNFSSAAFGVESGSDKMLRFLKSGSVSVEMNQHAINLCRKNGIELNLSFIIGTPGETPDDLDKTIDFIKRNQHNLSGIEIFVTLPYPGTKLWHYCLEKQLVSPTMDWNLFRTSAFFSDFNEDEDFFFCNPDMSRNTFKKYIRIFRGIDAEINRNNMSLFKNIEDSTPIGKKPDTVTP